MSVIPAFRRLRQEDCEFEASLGYTVRLCLKKKKNPSEEIIFPEPSQKRSVWCGAPYLRSDMEQ
jgi:hypothetical protein